MQNRRMPYVLDGQVGTTTIEAHGILHKITFKADQIRQEPVIQVKTEPSFVRNGTRIKVQWPEIASTNLSGARPKILQIAETYCAINPHLDLQITIDGQSRANSAASDANWPRWRPADPAPPHWYTPDTLERLIAAYVRDDHDRGRSTLVREFVAQFRGMSGSAKQKAVLEAVGASRTTLAEFFGSGDTVNKDGITALLRAMKEQSKPVKPLDLGFIGEDHLRAHLVAHGADPGTIRYKRIADATRPFIVEAAFGCGEDTQGRQLIGLNFSPAINNPIRELANILDDAWVSSDDPVIIALHITCPRFAFTDRGKGSIVISFSMRDAVADAIRLVTAPWTKQSKVEHREASARDRRMDRLTVRKKVSQKEAAYAIMEHAYRKASGPKGLPATATQIMYAARGHIQDATGKKLNRQYFNQTLLPAFIDDHPEITATWDVCYDDRGHFVDPHTDEIIGLGTKSVRNYLATVRDPDFRKPDVRGASIITCGPHGGFSGLLYIEKEGFLDILNAVQLAQRYDLAIMSCKGNSVTAARRLADNICHKYKIPLFVLHDFDKSGLTILGTLRGDTHRYQFENDIDVIDLGLRLEDVERLGLMDQSEAVFDKGDADKRAANMRKHGASDDEIAFLLHRRVELNALSSDQLVSFIEEKLIEHGVRKVVPPLSDLERAYHLFADGERVEKIVQDALHLSAGGTEIAVPADLELRVQQYLSEHPAVRWDEAVAQNRGLCIVTVRRDCSSSARQTGSHPPSRRVVPFF